MYPVSLVISSLWVMDQVGENWGTLGGDMVERKEMGGMGWTDAEKGELEIGARQQPPGKLVS